MLITKSVDLKCSGANKKHLLNLGYAWKFGVTLKEVHVIDLMPSSRAKIVFRCDYCQEEKEVQYSKYNLMHSNGGKDSCYNCRHHKLKETCQIKYGVDNPIQVKEFSEKVAFKRRTPYDEIVKLFDENNYTLLSNSNEYKNMSQSLRYICNKHKDYGVQNNNAHSIKNGSGCFLCGVEKITGSNNHGWKGGKTSLQLSLREWVKTWKEDSMKSSGYKCVISGDKADIIHHLYPFSKIVDETFSELNFDIRENTGDYSDDELISIKEKLNEIHYRYPLGVALTRKIHDDFHSVYGKEGFTVEDFHEFAKNYYDKTVTVSYGHYEKLKYFPYKKKGSSKYRGVVKVLNRYQAMIKYKNKETRLGSFLSEYDAAKAYNDKAIELFGPGTTLNRLHPDDLKKKEELRYYPPVVGESSRFNGVSYHKTDETRSDNWASRITVNGVRVLVGFFSTELEAAHAYNKRTIELFGDEARLNKLTDLEIKIAEHKFKYYDHREKAETIYTCVKFDFNQWQAEFTQNGKRHYVGRFKTDLHAALAYNYYVTKYKIERKLNYITDNSVSMDEVINIMEKDDTYYEHKTSGPTIYSCIRRENSKWSARVKVNNKEQRIGLFPTDKEAAIAYNEYVIEHTLNRKLNKII